MIKLRLLVPLCVCLVAGAVLSGCGSSSIFDIPPTIRDLKIVTPEERTGDINFTFEYYDNEDQFVDFTIQYSADEDKWEDATVLDSDGGSAARIDHRRMDDYNYWWDADGDGASGSSYFLRVIPGDAMLKIRDAVGPFSVGAL